MIDHEQLRQQYNPDGSQLRRQQLRMLDILIEVDRICKKHQIEYWLSSGTLIGALRHNGFIPWDDDLDIEMMRTDYLRLLEVLPRELPDWLALQSDETDPAYFFFYAKVRDRRSLMLENNGYDRMWKEQGIYIDIFPMERHPIWLHKLTEKSFGHAYKIWRTSTDDNRSLRQVRRIFRIEGVLIAAMGVAAGLLLGFVVCFVQQQWGVVKMGSNFVVNAFPVAMRGIDFLLTTAMVMALSTLAVLFAVRKNKV